MQSQLEKSLRRPPDNQSGGGGGPPFLFRQPMTADGRLLRESLKPWMPVITGAGFGEPPLDSMSMENLSMLIRELERVVYKLEYE